MNVRYIDDLIQDIHDCVKRHNLGRPGAYSRWSFGEDDYCTLNEYGVADAANILYSIGAFPSDPEERKEWIAVLQGMQNPETGMYVEHTDNPNRHKHYPIHTTAHCTAALELFDAKPLHKCTELEKYTQKENLYQLLEELNWRSNPWTESHTGAGILPSLTNTGMVGMEWKDFYFDWMWEHCDPETGYIMCGDEVASDSHCYMAGTFHYMFNHEAEHRPWRYPEKLIDSCLKLLDDYKKNGNLCHHCGFIEIDVVFCLTRASRQTPHRFHEVKAALEIFAERFLDMMYGLDKQTDVGFDDLHCLFGSVCCLAELQSALPGKIRTTKPLKLVLDRRPFI